MGSVKVVLFTLIFALTSEVGLAQTSAVEIREVTGGLDMSVNGLTLSITTDCDEALTTSVQTGITASCSGTCTGSDAVFSLSGHGTTAGLLEANGAIISGATLTVTSAGSGYKAGDVLTLTNDGSSTDADKFSSSTNAGGNIVITLSADDISVGGLVGTENALKSSITLDAAGEIDTTAETNVEASGGSGTDAKFSVAGAGAGNGAGVVTITCTSAGSGYKAGDVLTLTRASSTTAGQFVANAAGNIEITLSASDINGYVKVTPSSGFYRNVDGGLFNSNGDFTDAKKTGYYVALGKATQFIALKVDYGSGETVMPQIGGVTDTGLSDNGLSTKLLPVKDGVNVLKLVSSVDGTFVMNLIKPDDQIKKMETTDRSIEIAYNLAAVGEFTCAAFKGDVSDPSTRADVKAGDSVNTYKVMQEEIFNSVQMTLNGLTPDQLYEIHCYHSAHGIISHTAANGGAVISTDKASLTGVSLVPDTKVAGAYTYLTLTFTHEKTLASSDTIKLKLYNDYSNVQSLTAHGTPSTCGGSITIAKTGGINGADIPGAETCSDSSNELTITLAGASEVSSTSGGTEVVFKIEDGATNILLADNGKEGTVVTFDLEVSGHGKLLHEMGWTTTS